MWSLGLRLPPPSSSVGFCGDTEHSVEECLRGGRSFSMTTKCPSTETASSGPVKRVSATAVAPPAAVDSVISYLF